MLLVSRTIKLLMHIINNFYYQIVWMDDSCNQPCGRGHHKKKKKGLRSRFDRRKNDERRRQQANKENAGTVEHPVCTNPVPLSTQTLEKSFNFHQHSVLQAGEHTRWHMSSDCIGCLQLRTKLECICLWEKSARNMQPSQGVSKVYLLLECFVRPHFSYRSSCSLLRKSRRQLC